METTLTEDLALLAFNEDRGHYYDHSGSALPYALAATLILDLQAAGAVTLDDDKHRTVRVTGSAPDDALLAEAFASISGAGKDRTLKDWVMRPVHVVKHLPNAVYQHLTEQGVLAEDGKTLLRRDRYKAVDGTEGELVAGLAEVLDGTRPPEPGEILLLALLPECRLVGDVFPDRDHGATRKRIKELLEADDDAGDAAAQVARAVARDVALIMAVVIAGAVASNG